jgi:preprotein translocase subunit SecA
MSNLRVVQSLSLRPFHLSNVARIEQKDQELHKLEIFFANLLGWIPAKKISRTHIQKFAQAISPHREELKQLDQEQLIQKFQQAIQDLSTQPSHDAAIAVIFACVGEGVFRVFNIYPHPVQFMGAYILLTGRLAEMPTGEGKTLVAGMAATIMAATGNFVHVLTTNAYLAQRDEEELRSLFHFFQLSSAAIYGEMEIPERKENYHKQICYVSANEIVFDYLKDHISGKGTQPRQIENLRALATGQTSDDGMIVPALLFCIVDEADSVFIDEAQTPMVISQEAEGLIEAAIIHWAIEQAQQLVADVDFSILEAEHHVDIEKIPLNKEIPLPQNVRPIWYNHAWKMLLIKQALTALHLYHKDQHYIIQDNKIQIVDESTGRIMADRSWEQGLHQLIEAKEKVELTKGRDTLARMTFQRFFRRYLLLSGLTGTGLEVSKELWMIYRLKVCQIPPNIPSKRQQFKHHYFKNNKQKYIAIAKHAKTMADAKRSVLVGTRSIEASEAISEALTQLNIEHIVLNARQDAQEATIIAEAGHSGKITVATNMAGRGTDIKLRPETKQAGGLHVILTEFHESARIDRQLYGRAGRQGDQGSCVAYVSGEDQLMQQNIQGLIYLLNLIPIYVLRHYFLSLAVKHMQKKCQKRAYRNRISMFKQDKKLNSQIGFAGKIY